MDMSPLVGFLVILALLGVPVLLVFRKVRRAEKANGWPKTKATIQEAAMEVVAHSRYQEIDLPSFAFSYVVNGEYHSGRFSLLPSTGDRPEWVDRLKDAEFEVHYCPSSPNKFFIPEDSWPGCEVEQPINSNLVSMYPKD